MTQQFIAGESIIRSPVPLTADLGPLGCGYGIFNSLIAIGSRLRSSKIRRQTSVRIVHRKDRHIDQCAEGRAMVPASLLRFLVRIAGIGKIGANLQFVADIPVYIRPEIYPLLA